MSSSRYNRKIYQDLHKSAPFLKEIIKIVYLRALVHTKKLTNILISKRI